jgi:RNA polymerase sigma factor for flagellar operon FliA
LPTHFSTASPPVVAAARKSSKTSSCKPRSSKRAKATRSSAALERQWRAYRRRGGDAERNALVESYQPLVREIARRFAGRLPRSVDPGDLATASNVGLMAAIESFDATRNVPFESYCELRVKGALIDELRTQDWLPRPWRDRAERHKRAVERLRAQQGREPAEEDIAAEMGLAPEEYRQFFSFAVPGQPTGSMPVSGAGGEPVHSLDIVPDRSLESPGDRLTREELLHLVTQRLTAQEARIVYLKYWEDLPMREIGELEGLSESRVCKIHTRLLERLQERFRVHVGEAE